MLFLLLFLRVARCTAQTKTRWKTQTLNSIFCIHLRHICASFCIFTFFCFCFVVICVSIRLNTKCKYVCRSRLYYMYAVDIIYSFFAGTFIQKRKTEIAKQRKANECCCDCFTIQMMIEFVEKGLWLRELSLLICFFVVVFFFSLLSLVQIETLKSLLFAMHVHSAAHQSSQYFIFTVFSCVVGKEKKNKMFRFQFRTQRNNYSFFFQQTIRSMSE